jgi:F-type H+-transporting ATPase subunit a
VPERKILGIKRPIFIVGVILLLALSVVSFLAGALGESFFGDIGLPAWLSVDAPHPELPAEEIFSIGGFSITNTMFTAWLSILLLGGFFYAITRRIRLIPGRLQVAGEFILGWIYNLCKDAAGEKNGRRFFPIVATLFLFVLVNAWMNLIPGYGAILITNGHGESVHLLRGANTDINLPLALALVSFVAVEYWGFSSLGVGTYLKKFFNFGPFFRSFGKVLKGKVKEGTSGLFNSGVNIFVGILEFFLEFVRILSFTFRLFGNMTGGEILLLMMFFLLPFIGALPVYGLELLVGFVQALIFGGLTLSFATVAVTSHSGEAH